MLILSTMTYFLEQANINGIFLIHNYFKFFIYNTAHMSNFEISAKSKKSADLWPLIYNNILPSLTIDVIICNHY
jgi:hypothetical protein